jgi:site-specific DNA-methyltransferase (adenine-specific)
MRSLPIRPTASGSACRGDLGRGEKYADFREWDKAPSAEEVARLLAIAPTAIIWGGNYFALPPSRCWLIWDKHNAVPTMADIEMAWTNMDKPGKRFRWPVGVHANGHPTEKPAELMSWCIEKAGMPALIVDPYMGSGTTGVSAMKLGLRFIGVESRPDYFETCCRRIEDAQRQQRMFA